MTNVYCWAATHVGHVREQNEDALALSAPFDLSDTGTGKASSPASVSGLPSPTGMGGHAAGEVASRLAVEVLGGFLMEHATASDLVEALAAANWAIREGMEQEPAFMGMGTTVCGIVAVGSSMRRSI